MIDIDEMKKELIRDEGVKYSAYQDHLGYLTIGVGHLIDQRKGGTISPAIVDHILDEDIRVCLEDICHETWFLAAQTDSCRQALLNMRFQLGSAGIRSFKNSLSLISQRRFKEAGQQLRSSKWYLQTPIRAERICRMIEQD